LSDDETREQAANVQPLKDLFHISHFSRFYRLYIPVSILIGATCGLFMVALQFLIDTTTLLFSGLPLFLTPFIGGLFSGILIKLGRTEIQGSGISKAIELTHKPSALRPGIKFTKLVATSVSIGTGNPVGREGPAVLIGAGVGNTIGRRLGFDDDATLRVFFMMGSAAATAGIYKAPLGGALFATEAPYRKDARLGYFVPTVIAALTSFIVFTGIYQLITGNGTTPLFTFTAELQITLMEIPLLIIFGVVAGLISIFFAVSLMATRNFFTVKFPDWADPLVGSLLACVVIFVLSLVVDPSLTIAGMGYEVINTMANTLTTNPLPLLVIVLLLFGKLFASSFVVAGKVSGGVLASSLFVGAMLGSIFGEIFFPHNVAAFIVLGMGAVLAATTNTPVATIIMMLEMSLSFTLIIPLVICVTVSYLVSAGTSLYEGQKISRDDEEPGFYMPTNVLETGKLRFKKLDEEHSDDEDDKVNIV
jgi:CIC family chloride channel protein